MHKTLKSALQIFTAGWLLVMLFALPRFRRLVESHYVAQSAQLNDGSTNYYIPLVVNYWSSPPTLLISEVLFDPIGIDSEPEAEWVELYNYGKQEIILTDYMIGDSHEEGSKEGMYFFPPGAKILPDDVVVIAAYGSIFEGIYHFKPDFELRNTDPKITDTIIPDMILNTDWADGFMSLNNAGDEVFLLYTSGSPVDLVSWGDSTRAFSPSVPTVDEGHSIERYPPYVDTDTNTDWRDQPNPSPGEVDRTPPPTPTPTPTSNPITEFYLLISEVLFDPIDEEPLNEWIEIYNPNSVVVDLTGYKIGDEETKGGSEGMLQFPAGSIISPRDTIVIVRNAVIFRSKYAVMPDFEMDPSDPDVPDMEIYASWAGENIDMGNQGDEVLLLGAGDNVIDALSWGISTWAFNPSCTLPLEGHSLERYPADADTDSADDWREQAVPNPGEVPQSLK